jgi:uncharacterized protein (TIGR02246 family)
MEDSTDEKNITQLFADAASAWDSGNGKRYASHFTENCDYVTFFGEHIKGEQAIAGSHQQLFDSFVMKGSTLHQQVKDIRFLTADIAIVHCVGAVKLRFQKKAPTSRQSINTNIVVRQNGQWKITAFHNCRVQKPNFIQRLFMKDRNQQNA